MTACVISQTLVHLPTDNHDKLNRRKRGLFSLRGMAFGMLLFGLETQGDAKKLDEMISRLQIYNSKHTRILDVQARITHQHTEQLDKLCDVVDTITDQLEYLGPQ